MPLTVSKSVLCEIGSIAVYQSHIEGQMALFIQELLYLDESKGNIITARLSFGGLIDLLRSLLLEEFGSEHAHFIRFEELRRELSQREQQRNQIIHSMWSFGSTFKADSATRIKIVNNRSQGVRREVVQVTLEELRALAKAMEYLEWAISDLRVQICHHEADERIKRA